VLCTEDRGKSGRFHKAGVGIETELRSVVGGANAKSRVITGWEREAKSEGKTFDRRLRKYAEKTLELRIGEPAASYAGFVVDLT